MLLTDLFQSWLAVFGSFEKSSQCFLFKVESISSDGKGRTGVQARFAVSAAAHATGPEPKRLVFPERLVGIRDHVRARAAHQPRTFRPVPARRGARSRREAPLSAQ